MPENKLFEEISSLSTEQRNPHSALIDKQSTEEILRIINSEDRKVANAVEKIIPDITKAVDLITESFRTGGRLFYFGAGTSGRLGVVDASECPPTFGTDPNMVVGIIAGGKEAMFRAQEGAEDSLQLGAKQFDVYNITQKDIICGIAASGRTPFVKGAIDEARKRNIRSIMIATVAKSKVIELGIEADIFLCPEVGPEVITGSTRMKSGTAQKMVLNMLTTTSMVKLGKTLSNIMVDLQQTNEKLKERSKKILMTVTGINYEQAEQYLNEAGGHVKTAIVMILADIDKNEAEKLLLSTNGFVRKAIELKRPEFDFI